MRGPFHKSIYDTSKHVESYWRAHHANDLHYAPLERDETVEVAIIGGGYTGMTAAYILARDHGIEAAVLDAAPIGWGASGRNAGMCGLDCTKLGISQLIQEYGADETRRYFMSQVDAVRMVDELCIEENINVDKTGDGMVTVAHSAKSFAGLSEEHEVMSRGLRIDTELLSAEAYAEQGFTGPSNRGALVTRPSFGLNPMKFIQGLARAAHRRGARIFPNSEVTKWTRSGNQHILHTAQGRLTANKVLIATNGFTQDRLHPAIKGRAMPVLSNIIVTQPIPDDLRAAQGWQDDRPICTDRNMLHYFRMLPDNRLLIGARGDVKGTPRKGKSMKRQVTKDMHRMFPAWKKVKAEYFWRGPICATRDLTPSIGALPDDPTVWHAFGWHGNGVNSATWAGAMIGQMIADPSAVMTALPEIYRGLPKRIPMPGFRPLYLKSAIQYYKVIDKMNG